MRKKIGMENKPNIYTGSQVFPELYSGVPTFMGLPKVTSKEEIKDYDVAIMGVPWEGGCTYGGFSMCMMSPKAIREKSTRYIGYLPDYDIDTFDYLSACDFGDCKVQNGNYDYSFASMAEKIGEIYDAGAMPVVFGGDHSITNPLVAELAKKHPKRVGIIQFDAHLDCMPSFGDDLNSRCSPFYRIYENENIDPTKIVHLGIRGPRNHPAEAAAAKKFGANIITTIEVKKSGYEAAIKKALEIVKKDTDVVYVTVCSDVLDAAANPEGPVDPCGITTFELAMMLNECGYAGVDSFDYVEIEPTNFGRNTSAHNVCWMVAYLLNGKARRIRDNMEKQK